MSISVLICCYNGERFLRETLESVLAQTVHPREVIVIDDGSTDRSAEIAGSFGSPVRVISQPNQGLPASRNVGIQAATGEYLFFIDADDLIHPTSLQRLRDALEGKRDTVAIMGFRPFREKVEEPLSEQTYDFETFFPAIIGGNFGPQHNRLIPRELAIRAGCFDPTMFLFEDWLFWCRVALCDARLAPVPIVGAYYRRHDNTMSDTAAPVAAIRGHARVMTELGAGVLGRPDLLEHHGVPLFWGTWTAFHRGQRAGLTTKELDPLVRHLERIVREGPKEVRNIKFARLIRLLGVRWAERLRNLVARRSGDELRVNSGSAMAACV
jgi:glycosyltransferase involved in cell wall biosynthesis